MLEKDELQETIKDVLGYGTVIKVLIGKDKDNKSVIEEFHFTPVSLEDMPAMSKNLNRFANMQFSEAMDKASDGKNKKDAGKNITNEKNSGSVIPQEMIEVGIDIIHLSLKKMHPNISKDEIKKKFGLSIIPKAVRVAMDMNDFLTEMRGVNQDIMKATR